MHNIHDFILFYYFFALRQKGGKKKISRSKLTLSFLCVMFSLYVGNAVRAQICHVIQEQHWKLEVRRLLQWPSNGWIMQLQSSGCPHYLAGEVMNGLKCVLSKSQEKCDPSSEIQMVPLQLHSTSLYVLLITRLMISLIRAANPVVTWDGKNLSPRFSFPSQDLQTLLCCLPQNIIGL